MSTAQALLLNSDYTPYKVVTWERAVGLILEKRADLVEGYVDRFIRSASAVVMEWPAVLRLRNFVKPKPRIRFSRLHVLARDNHTCAYCGVQPRTQAGRPLLEELTLDHVIPRAQAVHGQVIGIYGRRTAVTSWVNVVCCCSPCNLQKADRTPGQAGMPLLFQPKPPTMVDVLRIHLRKVTIPAEWKQYLPEGAKDWGNYWETELSPD